ncbi:hypothetical protein B566_EDAN001591 [Ephemera danica]|nr:hypothetical protein B566_EDAN001591 [Ephemera danica]
MHLRHNQHCYFNFGVSCSLCPLDLDVTIKEAKNAVDLFFNNKFDEARSSLEPLANVSMYHALGNSVFKFLEAVMTFEQEVHAELCYAESLLLKAMLTFIEDETLSFFFCWFRECSHILQHRNWTADCRKVHFESGVRMGVGAFNLMISLLPARVIKLLEFIGFSGSKVKKKDYKDIGLRELETGYRLHESLRQVLCVMVLLGYHLIVVYVLSYNDGDLNFCDEILRHQLQMYPEGAWFLFFKGRLEFMKGNITEAIYWYTKSWKSQDVWPQFHHLCFWELMFTNSIHQDWRQAAAFAGMLVDESRWSKTIYSYQKGAMLSMLGDALSEDDRKEIDGLMKLSLESSADNLALVLLLKGACLRQMKSPLQSEECLKEVISLESKIKEDVFLIPYAIVELALLLTDQKDYTKASQLLEDAKKNYTGYSLESRLHFKIHSAQMDLQGTK